MWIVEIPLKYDQRLARTIKTDKDLALFPRKSPKKPIRRVFQSKDEALRVKDDLEAQGIRAELYLLEKMGDRHAKTD